MRYFSIVSFFILISSSIVSGQELKLTLFRQQGEGTCWSPDGKRIAYDLKGPKPKEYYEIHVADSNGMHDTCLSCRCADLPQKETGSPDWSPDGKYMILVSEKAVHKGPYYAAIPGFGGYSDIWVMTADGKHAWKVLETNNDPNDGIIAPKFSHDGKHVVWVQRKRSPHIFRKKQFFGLWVIKTADFVDGSNGPKLENIKTFEPKGDAFYETYGFSPDNKRIIFCSNMDVPFWWLCRIYTIDAATGGDIKQLTTNDYNEHARYANNGKWIVWMTNTNATRQGTDWWIMKPDGTQKQRLTYFNEPGFPQYTGHKKWACLVAFSPDDKKFAGCAQYSLFKQEGSIFMGEFLPCGNGDGLNAEYYTTENFSGDKKVRNDPAVNFRWGKPWPDSLITSDNYSVRWTGYVQPLYSETYTLYSYAGKNTSVWINDTLVIGPNTPKIKYHEKMAQINFVAGKKYKLRVEYYNKKQNKGVAILAWSSEHQYKQAIPASQLFTTN